MTGTRASCFTLADVARENGRSFPGRPAVVCGDERLTFDEIDRRTDRLAAWLVARGVEPGERVVWLGRSSHMVLDLLFAAAKAGAVLIPVNWRLAPEEVAAVVEAARPHTIVVAPDADLAAARRAAQRAAHVEQLVEQAAVEQVAVTGGARASGGDPARDTGDELPVLGFGLVMPDGRTRIALIPQRAVVMQCLALAVAGIVQARGEIHLGSGPLFHVGAFLPVLATFHAGGMSVIAPDADPERVCELIARERCTSAYLMTPTIERIVALNAGGRFDLSSLRFAMGRPSPTARDAWHGMTACGETADSGMVGYGQTQTFGMVTQVSRAPGSDGNVGVASPVAAVRIVDSAGRECPPGTVGELAVRGPLLMTGYLDAADEASELHPPGALGGGWHLTGDLAVREDDGSMTFVGPATDLIKTGMESVQPLEVERALRAHPRVAEVCVIGVRDAVWGERVHAVIEADGEGPTLEELRQFVGGRLARYKHPRGVEVVGALPRTTAGVVDRAAVQSTYGSTS